MSNNYNESTKKVLQQQLGSLFTSNEDKERSPASTTYNQDIVYEEEDYNPYSYGENDLYSDLMRAEDLIESMEMNPAEIYRIISAEDTDTIVNIVSILLHR